VPDEATLVGFQEPTGDLESFKLESFDYDVNGGNQPQTAIGIVIPASGGPVPVGSANPLPVSQGTAANLNATVVGTGTFAVQVSTSGLPTGASTLAEQQTQTAVLGATSGAAVITDANGTIQQYLRGLVKLAITVGGWLATVSGVVADDAANTSSNPVKIGGFARAPAIDPGNVSADNDIATLTTDLQRRLYVETTQSGTLTYQENSSSALTDATVQSAPGAGYELVITNIICSTGAATAWNMVLENDGSTVIFGPIYLEAVAGRGFCSGPIYKTVGANKALTVTTSAAIAHSISIQYHSRKL
jgi:hypothetical protein